jgi:hypothetical protein
MLKVEFPYCKFNPDFLGCNCDEPCLLVTLKEGGKEITVEAMVDSGCTVTHANSALAGELGIDLRICIPTKTIGISGEMEEAWMTEITFSLPGLGDDFRGPVLFTKNLPVSILLGQKNFFDTFDVHFQKSKHLFTLTRVDA